MKKAVVCYKALHTHTHQLKDGDGQNLKRDVQYFSHPALIHRNTFSVDYTSRSNTSVRVHRGRKGIYVWYSVSIIPLSTFLLPSR